VRTINRSAALVEPLSDRELDGLRLLGTDLDGPDVARAFPSLNTMRTHAKNIYAKLRVASRRAVRQARDLILLAESGRRLTILPADARTFHHLAHQVW
jgi:LuxR family transcriptional regulator, maltose regulon positive regulatory protein